MPRWLLFSLITIVLWGAWGFISKLSDIYAPVNGWILQAYMTIGMLPALLIAARSPAARQGTNRRQGAIIAFVTGLLGCTANATTYVAFTLHGPASIVLPIQAVYPVLTTVAAWVILRERINGVQMLGILGGIAGIVILTAAAGDAGDGTFVDALRHAMREPWMVFTLIALVAQAVAGVTQKMCTNALSPEGSFIYFTIAFVPVALVIALVSFLVPGLSWSAHNHAWSIGGWAWAVCIGVGLTCGLGVLASFVAYRDGKASIVTALTGMYPVATALLAVLILKEKFTIFTAVGTVLAVGGAAAMSYERRAATTTAPAAAFGASPGSSGPITDPLAPTN